MATDRLKAYEGLSDRLPERVARDFRTQIEAGRLRDGEALPSTRAIAESLGVSVFTVNEAMKILAADGLVENRSRSGRVVRSQVDRDARLYEGRHAVLVGGYAGSGKSELGRVLARLTGWPVIDKDTITRPVVEVALEAMGSVPSDRESQTYMDRIRPREYEALMDTAHEVSELGSQSIVTAPFIKELGDSMWVEQQRSLFSQDGVSMSVIWVCCDVETMHTYIRRRGAARDAVKLANWAEYASGINVDFRPQGTHFVVDNSQSAELLVNQARRFLGQLEQGER